MHKDMNRLYELQQVDTAIAELEADLKALDDGSRLRAELAAAEAALAQCQGAYAEGLGAQRKREAELQKTEEKRKQLMAKAYGGTISNPKELETLEKEIESLSRQKDRIETELLEMFDQVDERKRHDAEQEKRVAELKRRLGETITTFESEGARLGAEIAKLGTDRAGVAQPIGPDVLRKYEYLRERCSNLALVPVEGSTCSGCRIGLPLVQVARLRRESELQQCESCLRLLWVETDDDDDE